MQSAYPVRTLSQLTLRIRDAVSSLDFYQNKLGMALIDKQIQKTGGKSENHYFLGFTDTYQKPCREELIHRGITILELVETRKAFNNTQPNMGYWKIGITLPHIDLARQQLIDQGIRISQPRQFMDVGYLCHLQDPNDYVIELLQHTFEKNHQPDKFDQKYKLGSQPTLGQITLRIKNPEASLRFYQQQLGMKLLSRQIIEPYGFTLYFLACTDESPPIDNIDAVENREWLWQRPYTTLELQHIWENDNLDFKYQCGPETGFVLIGFEGVNNRKVCCNQEGFAAKDSDGYRVQFSRVSGYP